MIFSVVSYKGGVGKTTTAIHLAAYLQTLRPTLLLDGDKTRNAIGWSQRGTGFAFRVAPVSQAAKLVPEFSHSGHIVIDTGQREDLQEAVEACDLLIIPATPGSLDTDGLVQTIQALKQIPGARYRVLITRVPPPPEREAIELRHLLKAEEVPLFSVDIPRLKAFEKAAAAGQVVSQVDDRNAARAWNAYASAGKELGV